MKQTKHTDFLPFAAALNRIDALVGAFPTSAHQHSDTIAPAHAAAGVASHQQQSSTTTTSLDNVVVHTSPLYQRAGAADTLASVAPVRADIKSLVQSAYCGDLSEALVTELKLWMMSTASSHVDDIITQVLDRMEYGRCFTGCTVVYEICWNAHQAAAPT
jgi:hypothetical protein